MKYFSFNDLEAANYIAANKEAKDFEGKNLYPPSWVKWSQRVIKFYKKFWSLYRDFIKTLKDSALTVKAVWDAIKSNVFSQIFAKVSYKEPTRKIKRDTKTLLSVRTKSSTNKKESVRAKMVRTEAFYINKAQKSLDKDNRRLKRKLMYC